MQLGYFQVIAEPVSTCVQEIFDARPAAGAALGHEVVDAAVALLVAGIPVLHRRILDLRVVADRHQLDHRGVQLVLVAHRGRAAFEVADVRPFLGDDQRPLELAGVRRVDAEIGGQLHRAAHALGDVAERAVAEDRRVQGGEEVVVVRHHRAEVLAAPAPDGSRTASEKEQKMMPISASLLLERRGHRHAVEDGIDGHAAQPLLLVQRDAQLLEGAPQLGIDLVEAVELLLRLRGGVVDDVLVVDGGDAQVAATSAAPPSSASGGRP